jgi:hypothetical protein
LNENKGIPAISIELLEEIRDAVALYSTDLVEERVLFPSY